MRKGVPVRWTNGQHLRLFYHLVFVRVSQGHQSEKLTQYFEQYLVSSYAFHSVEKGAAIIQKLVTNKFHRGDMLRSSSMGAITVKPKHNPVNPVTVTVNIQSILIFPHSGCRGHS